MAPKRAKILAVSKKEKRGRHGAGSLRLRGRIWWVRYREVNEHNP
jgi:hypothetical protein